MGSFLSRTQQPDEEPHRPINQATRNGVRASNAAFRNAQRRREERRQQAVAGPPNTGDPTVPTYPSRQNLPSNGTEDPVAPNDTDNPTMGGYRKKRRSTKKRTRKHRRHH